MGFLRNVSINTLRKDDDDDDNNNNNNLELNELRTAMNVELGGTEKEVHFKLLSRNSSC
jgi:hypothetical protein